MSDIYYSKPEYGDDYKYSIQTLFTRIEDAEYIAEECAQDFFENHDGWEYSWPITFHLFRSEDEVTPFAVVEIEQELTSVFNGTIKQNGDDNNETN